MSTSPPIDRFSFRFTPAYEAAGRVFGVTPSSTEAIISFTDLIVRFGLWRVQTPLSNISAVEVTGPYMFVKTAGPARLAVTDSGLTFATNGDRGVLLTFTERVRGIEPTGLLRHEELTLTVEDIDGFVTRLRAGIAAQPQPQPQPGG